MEGSMLLPEGGVALASVPVMRHCFRAQFSLVEGSSKLDRSPNWYVLLVPKLGSHELNGRLCCSDHRIRISGTSLRGHPVQTFEFKHFIIANVPASALPSIEVEHNFISHSVSLETCDHPHVVPPPPLDSRERRAALADDCYRVDKMRELLRAQSLERYEHESDLNYAKRLGQSFGDERFAYDAAATDAALHLLPTLVFEQYRGDCTAFNAGFVYALRSQGIPARLCLGLKYGHDIERDVGSFFASHVTSEFFAEGVGWIPCDVTCGLKSFGQAGTSRSNFVQWHTATSSFAEALELGEVMRSASGGAEGVVTKLKKLVGRQGLGNDSVVGVADLKKPLATALGISDDSAEHRALEVLTFEAFCRKRGCGMVRTDCPQTSFGDFCEAFVALEIGRCPVHFGAGKTLSGCAMAGAALLAGGPYEDGVPLDINDLVETAMVLDGHDRVAAAMGSSASNHESAGPPGGIFRVKLKFSEEALT